MKLKTEGERLFTFIRNDVLESIGSNSVRWSTVGILFNQCGDTYEFSDFIRGAVSVLAMRRLLRYWTAEKVITADASLYVKKIKMFAKEEVFPGLSDDLVTRLARAVIAAEAVSSKKISPSVRKIVIGKSNLHRCYLCNAELDASVPEKQPKHLTLEHLWPASIGGNSIEENLLPACVSCQEDTKDTMSWEWLNVHNLVLPPEPSKEALVAITRKQRVAKHFHAAIAKRDAQGISLKEAFLQIGPIKKSLTHTNTGSPITFFDLHTV